MKELVCKFGKESWTVVVQPLKTDVREDFYELIVSGDGSQFHLIIGTYAQGKFLCIPKLSTQFVIGSILANSYPSGMLKRLFVF